MYKYSPTQVFTCNIYVKHVTRKKCWQKISE